MRREFLEVSRRNGGTSSKEPVKFSAPGALGGWQSSSLDVPVAADLPRSSSSRVSGAFVMKSSFREMRGSYLQQA